MQIERPDKQDSTDGTLIGKGAVRVGMAAALAGGFAFGQSAFASADQLMTITKGTPAGFPGVTCKGSNDAGQTTGRAYLYESGFRGQMVTNGGSAYVKGIARTYSSQYGYHFVHTPSLSNNGQTSATQTPFQATIQQLGCEVWSVDGAYSGSTVNRQIDMGGVQTVAVRAQMMALTSMLGWTTSTVNGISAFYGCGGEPACW